MSMMTADWTSNHSSDSGLVPSQSSTTEPGDSQVPDQPVLPQWKIDFLAKKKALQLHQQRLADRNYKLTDPPKVDNNEISTGLSNCPDDNEDDNYSVGQLKGVPYNGNDNLLNNHSHSDKHNTVIDSDTALAAEESNSSEDMDSTGSTDGEVEESSKSQLKKSGGYSFITGKHFDHAVSESEDESLNSSIKDTPETESETEGSTELKYRPGFVSKLLDRWSTISYQSNGIPATNNTKPTMKPRPTSLISSSQRPIGTPAPFYLSKSKSLTDNNLKQENAPIQQGLTSSVRGDGSNSVANHRVVDQDKLTNNSNHNSVVHHSSKLDRRSSYRAPDEIILIESTTSPREQMRDRDSISQDSLPQLQVSEEVLQQSVKTTTHAGESEWTADLSVHDKVLLARAVFESSGGTLPVAPPRKKKAGKITSPPPETQKSEVVEIQSSATTLNDINIVERSDKKESSVGAAGSKTESTTLPPAPENKAVIVSKPCKPEYKPKTSSSAPKGGQSSVANGESNMATTTSAPLFTSIKLKATKHNLYGNSEDSSNPADSQNNSSDLVLSPRTRARIAKAKAPQPPNNNNMAKKESEAIVKPEVEVKKVIDHVILPDSTTTESVTDSTDVKVDPEPDQKTPKSVKELTNRYFQNGPEIIIVPANQKAQTISTANGSSDSNHVRQSLTKNNENSTYKSIPSTIDKTDACQPASNGASINTDTHTSKEKTSTVVQAPEKQILPSKSNTKATVIDSKQSKPVTDKPVIAKSTATPIAKSLNDIPSAPVKSTASQQKQNDENDFQAVLRRRQEKKASNDVPFTNIDDILKPSGRSNSKSVFDSRKVMGKERKVPEYEKIRDGPVLEFQDDKVIIGKSCLKVSSATIKKNLSFNELEPAVHEYLSEKIMIQDMAKEEGAVYWDDPDHLQAAPDRSVDEPEPTTKSSLRSSLKGTPTIIGSLATHQSSYHGEYSFGQTLVTPSEDSVVREDNSYTESTSSDSLAIKPADESDVKSWSSAGSSDMLF